LTFFWYFYQNHLPDLKVHAYFAPVTPPPSVTPRPRYCRCCVILWLSYSKQSNELIISFINYIIFITHRMVHLIHLFIWNKSIFLIKRFISYPLSWIDRIWLSLICVTYTTLLPDYFFSVSHFAISGIIFWLIGFHRNNHLWIVVNMDKHKYCLRLLFSTNVNNFNLIDIQMFMIRSCKIKPYLYWYISMTSLLFISIQFHSKIWRVWQNKTSKRIWIYIFWWSFANNFSNLIFKI